MSRNVPGKFAIHSPYLLLYYVSINCVVARDKPKRKNSHMRRFDDSIPLINPGVYNFHTLVRSNETKIPLLSICFTIILPFQNCRFLMAAVCHIAIGQTDWCTWNLPDHVTRRLDFTLLVPPNDSTSDLVYPYVLNTITSFGYT